MSVIDFRLLSNEPRQQVKERTKNEPDNAEGQQQAQPVPLSDVGVISEAAEKQGKEYNLHHEFRLLHCS